MGAAGGPAGSAGSQVDVDRVDIRIKGSSVSSKSKRTSSQLPSRMGSVARVLESPGFLPDQDFAPVGEDFAFDGTSAALTHHSSL